MAGHGGKFNLLKQPNTWQCLKIPHDSRTQDCQQRKNIELIENIRYVAMLKNSAMFENTDERRKSWKYHKIFSHGAFDFWRYHKIASNGEKFNLFNLKPPTRQCLKIPQDCRPRTQYFAQFENTTKYFAIFENTTRFSAGRKHLNYWRHQICDNVREYHKIAGHGEKLKLLKPPNDFDFWRYHKIASNRENSIYWSHQKGNAQRGKI